jgi:hypothetical protein
MKAMLLAAATTLSLGIGSAYSGENEDGAVICGAPHPECTQEIVPRVVTHAPVRNAPPVAATTQNKRPILLY